jgi:polyisoprenoid-binding protein YceI
LIHKNNPNYKSLKTKQMNTSRLKNAFLFSTLLLISGTLTGQVLKIVPKNSVITINGTSNLHDWKSKSEQINGELILSGNNQVKSFKLDIPVKSIKSGEKLMDSKTYETFDANKHPNIAFRLTDVTNLQINGDNVNVVFNGNLTMAGTTRKVAIKANGKNIKQGTYVFNGNVPLKMTDFQMKPPTALLGTLKVGDGIKLEFDITLTEQSQASID